MVSKDEWNTKEDSGKSMKNALYMYSGMVKGTSWAEAMSYRKPVSLAIVELHKSEGIRQAASQSVENPIKYVYIFRIL